MAFLTPDQIDRLTTGVVGLIQQTLQDQPPAADAIQSTDRPFLTTQEAARLLGRRPQTLRGWASSEQGLLRPHRIGRRLMWPTTEIRALLKIEAK